MKTRKDNPGVYIPPPLIYVIIFFLSIFLQRYFPISGLTFGSTSNYYLALIFFGFGLMCLFPAVYTFFRTRNTLVTIKSANSLQIKGIYQFSRNPMYLGLLFVYLGIAFLIGNYWTFILIPILVFVVTQVVIKKEEAYLERAFGATYLDYKSKVRRWF